MPYIYGVLPPVASLKPFEGIVPVKPHITLLKIERPKVVSVDFRAFTAFIGDVLFLPSRSRPRYIALAVEPRLEFMALRRALEALLAEVLVERHGDFKPHLSVYAVRIKSPTMDELAPAVEEASRLKGAAFDVRSVALIDTSGGEYKPLYTIQLK
ncbi:MAG: 2'-5' RNA ligase family protein [Thermoproteus sp.]